MSFGQLGAVIVNSNGTTGDGSLEINIPGKMQNVIFMSCRLSGFVKIAEGLDEQTNTFLNQMLNIIHKCTARWDGSANKNDGDVYLITWLLPSTEQTSDNESEAKLLEQRTDFADKSLIAAVKIVSEMRRATYLKDYFRKKRLLQAFGDDAAAQPYITIGIH